MVFNPSYLSIAECASLTGGTAVVIDVFRAFSTAAWALHRGVERIVLTDELDEALRLKAMLPGSLTLRDREPTPGFDLTNSPAHIRDHLDLNGRTLVQRTTSGTVGAVAARRAEQLYCASFLCAAATAAAIRRSGTAAAYFVVTGEGGLADEDRACAEYIAALVDNPTADAKPYLERARSSTMADTLRTRLAAGTLGDHADDIDLCLEANRFDLAMMVREEGGLLCLRRVEA